MQNVQVLRLEATQLVNRLPVEALPQVIDILSSLKENFTNFYNNSHTEHALDEPQEPLSDKILELRRQLIEDYGDGPVPGDTPFIGGVTLDEYYTLSDENQGKLWDKESKIGLVEYEEVEVPPHVMCRMEIRGLNSMQLEQADEPHDKWLTTLEHQGYFDI